MSSASSAWPLTPLGSWTRWELRIRPLL